MKNLFGEEIEKETEEVEEKKKKEGPFDLMKLMFTKKAEFEKVPVHEKEKQFFMLQRFFAIKQPQISEAFNVLKINGGRVVECWGRMLGNIYNVQPPWILSTLSAMKGKKKIEAKKKQFSEEAIEMFCKKNMMSRRDYETMVEFCPEKVQEEVGEYELFLNHEADKSKHK